MSSELAAEHRQALTALTVYTQRDLDTLFANLRAYPLDEAYGALMEAVPILAETYGYMAAALAMDFYENMREEADVASRFTAEPAPLPGTARYEALVRWGMQPAYADDPTVALTRLSGGLQRIVANSSRETVTLNSERDPQAKGWKRVARGDGCRWCQMLASRGAVYRQSSVRFASHDDCHCTAAPAFGSEPSVSVVQYQASKRVQTEADRARVREYLRRN